MKIPKILIAGISALFSSYAAADQHSTDGTEANNMPAKEIVKEIRELRKETKGYARSFDAKLEKIDKRLRVYNPAIERLSQKLIVSLLSSDDGYFVEINGKRIAARGGNAMTYSPPVKHDIYSMLIDRYTNSRASGVEFKMWSDVMEQVTAGNPITISVKCNNNGGPSHINYQISLGSVQRGRKLNGSSAGGVSCQDTYHVCYDTVLNSDIISNLGVDCGDTARPFNTQR